MKINFLSYTSIFIFFTSLYFQLKLKTGDIHSAYICPIINNYGDDQFNIPRREMEK